MEDGRRIVALAGGGLILALLGLGGVLLSSADDPTERNAPVPESTAPQAAPAAETATLPGEDAGVGVAPIKPTFDVVRVAEDGRAVIAGRAEEDAAVEVLVDGVALPATDADGRGEWVLVPDAPIPPGQHTLSLRATNRAGQVVLGEQSVVIDVAPPADGGQTLAVLVDPSTDPVAVLQGPGGNASLTTDIPLAVARIDHDAAGNATIQGTAAPGALVRLYLNNDRIGDAAVAEDGGWTLVPDKPLPLGQHELRVDELGDGSNVDARIVVAFERVGAAAVAATDAVSGEVIVQRGNSLWRIARRLYGSGFAYTVIYQANQDRIRDPDLIYPGQVFAVPVEAN